MKLQPKSFKKPSKSTTPNLTPSLRKNWLRLGAVVLILGAALAYFALRSDGLVTLDVKDAEVKDVVEKMAKQTRKTIYVTPGTSGKVTIKIRKKPLNEALEIVQGQTGAMWREFYAISESREKIRSLQKSLSEGTPADDWKVSRAEFWGAFGLPGRGFWGDSAKPQSVTYDALNKTAKDVALALAYRVSASILVSDSLADEQVTINFSEMKAGEAIEKFAKALNAKSEHFYVVGSGARRANRESQTANTTGEGAGGRRRGAAATTGDVAANTGTGDATTALPASARPRDGAAMGRTAGGPPSDPFGEGPSMTPEERERRRAEMERQMRARMEAMTPEQRQQAERIRGAFEQLRQQEASLTPAQRLNAVQNIMAANPQIQERGTKQLMERLKTTTPDQRVKFYRQVMEGQKRFQEQMNQQSGPRP